MKAMQFDAYGGPDRLRPSERPRPEPGPGQLLVRVRATSVNPIDWKLHAGMLRWIRRVRFPSVPCFDFAGTVEPHAGLPTGWAPGTAVFGMLPLSAMGAAAEFIAVDATLACRVPDGLDLMPMAGLPLAGLTALQGLRDRGRLRAGQSVMIIGAAGGVGHHAVQIARRLGARVTTVTSARNLDFCRELGAEVVLDRAGAARPPDGSQDLILDCAGHDGYGRWRPALRRGGGYVGLLPSPALLLRALPERLLTGRRLAVVLAGPSAPDLDWLARQVAENGLRTVVDTVHPLGELAAALRQSQAGHARGKILVSVSD